MPHYFKPLRRKIGVTTLVVALFFLGLWSHGQLSTIWNVARVPFGENMEYEIRLKPDGIHFLEYTSSQYGWLISSAPLRVTNKHLATVQYWPIIVPCTLLSAWLLLSKPRAKKLPATELVVRPES